MEKHTMPVFAFAFLQSQETGQRGGSSVHAHHPKHLVRVHLLAHPRVVQGCKKKRVFRDFLLTVGQQGGGR